MTASRSALLELADTFYNIAQDLEYLEGDCQREGLHALAGWCSDACEEARSQAEDLEEQARLTDEQYREAVALFLGQRGLTQEDFNVRDDAGVSADEDGAWVACEVFIEADAAGRLLADAKRERNEWTV